MDNYSLPLCKCRCVECGNVFYCIKPVWRCKSCDEKLRNINRKAMNNSKKVGVKNERR